MSETTKKEFATLFRVCLGITSNTPIGGPYLALHLVVNPLDNTLSGEGLLTQATNPPLRVSFKITGRYYDEGGRIHVFFEGSSSPGLGSWQIRGQLLLASWKEGIAEYEFGNASIPIGPIRVEGKAEKIPC